MNGTSTCIGNEGTSAIYLLSVWVDGRGGSCTQTETFSKAFRLRPRSPFGIKEKPTQTERVFKEPSNREKELEIWKAKAGGTAGSAPEIELQCWATFQEIVGKVAQGKGR